ncbi:hypothetical protein N6H14_01395 [Paenibacillus sp. CC-CFT747]|nr:hypothetical protein N6H14_01395 [Paenibacillus sp. CC-CFT747]
MEEEITVRKAAVLSIFTDLLHSIAGLFRGRDLRPNMLNADLIEGTLVNVEYTRARLIRGNRVVIGPHCEVERVEYTESLTVDPSASVGSSTET